MTQRGLKLLFSLLPGSKFISDILSGWENICCFAEVDYFSFRNHNELTGCCDVTGRSTALARVLGCQLDAENCNSATVLT